MRCLVLALGAGLTLVGCLSTPDPTVVPDAPPTPPPDATPIDAPPPQAPELREACRVHSSAPANNRCVAIVVEAAPACEQRWTDTCIALADTMCNAWCGEVAAIAGDGELAVARWNGTDFESTWTADGVAGWFVVDVAWGAIDDAVADRAAAKPDLVSCEYEDGAADSTVRIWRNEGAAFTSVRDYDLGNGCLDVEWIDVDGTGTLDIVVDSTYGSWWIKNVAGTFGELVELEVGAIVSDHAWVDLDADGLLDVATAKYEGPIVVSHNDGGGVLTAGETDAETHRWHDVAWGDVDGDGRPDLIVAGQDVLEVRRNTAADGYAPAATPWFTAPKRRNKAIALIDADEDATRDLDLLSIADSARIELYRNDGTGFVELPVWFTDGTDSPFPDTSGDTRLDVADVDGDGHRDFVACVVPSGCKLWRGTPTGELLFAEVPLATAANRGRIKLTASWAAIAR